MSSKAKRSTIYRNKGFLFKPPLAFFVKIMKNIEIDLLKENLKFFPFLQRDPKIVDQ